VFLEERFDELWMEVSTAGGSVFRRTIVRMAEGTRFRQLYRRVGMRADSVVVISPDEQREFGHVIDPRKIVVLPHGVDLERFEGRTDVSPRYDLITYGYTSLVNNADFLAEVIREVDHLSRGQIRWALAGPQLPPILARLPTVVHLGKVEDIRECVSRARIVVVPSRVTSGVKTTVLEAWALGRPVIATTRAMRGLQWVEGVHALTADSASDLARLIVGLIDDPGLRVALGNAGRAQVARHYDIRRTMQEFARQLANEYA
jgi:glycosyltransferase involved in cell wall biosynthesis